MKIGILACIYDLPDLAAKCLDPLFKLKDELNLVIGCCHGQFKEYAEFSPKDDSATLNILKDYEFDCFYRSTEPDLEHKIRDVVLQQLLSMEVDYVVLLDGDEIWTEDQIRSLAQTIKKNPLYTWFSIEYKNLTFNENLYTLGFCPPRVFKVNQSNIRLHKFYWDNDVYYENPQAGTLISYKLLSGKAIKNIVPLHYTWLNDDRSKNKIEYQNRHFGPGNCSFKWDNGLCWNAEFFMKNGTQPPKLLTISDG